MSVGQCIRETRKAAGMTQIELAHAAGIAVNTLRRYEADQCECRFSLIERIAQALGVSVFWLLRDKFEKEMITMHRNLEHYADPTAGDAISKTQKPQRGEIWRATRKNSAASTLVLVIATHATISNVLVLEEKAYDDYYVLKLTENNYKYYNPARYSWEMNDHFISRVCTLQESEFDKVLNNLGYTHKFGR